MANTTANECCYLSAQQVNWLFDGYGFNVITKPDNVTASYGTVVLTVPLNVIIAVR